MTPEKLVSMALDAMQHAYAPYSGYKVGAALLCKDGSVVCGANIENAAYGPSNCAERTAIFTAVFEGKRDFAAIAVVGGKDGVASEGSSPDPLPANGRIRERQDGTIFQSSRRRKRFWTRLWTRKRT